MSFNELQISQKEPTVRPVAILENQNSEFQEKNLNGIMQRSYPLLNLAFYSIIYSNLIESRSVSGIHLYLKTTRVHASEVPMEQISKPIRC